MGSGLASVTSSSHHTDLGGAPGGSRTPGPRLRRPLLYPAELQARATCFCPQSGMASSRRVLGRGVTHSSVIGYGTRAGRICRHDCPVEGDHGRASIRGMDRRPVRHFDHARPGPISGWGWHERAINPAGGRDKHDGHECAAHRTQLHQHDPRSSSGLPVRITVSYRTARPRFMACGAPASVLGGCRRLQRRALDRRRALVHKARPVPRVQGRGGVGGWLR